MNLNFVTHTKVPYSDRYRYRATILQAQRKWSTRSVKRFWFCLTISLGSARGILRSPKQSRRTRLIAPSGTALHALPADVNGR